MEKHTSNNIKKSSEMEEQWDYILNLAHSLDIFLSCDELLIKFLFPFDISLSSCHSSFCQWNLNPNCRQDFFLCVFSMRALKRFTSGNTFGHLFGFPWTFRDREALSGQSKEKISWCCLLPQASLVNLSCNSIKLLINLENQEDIEGNTRQFYYYHEPGSSKHHFISYFGKYSTIICHQISPTSWTKTILKIRCRNLEYLKGYTPMFVISFFYL